jgi:hypothetical protein
MSFAAQLGVALGSFALASALAGLLGASSLGIALSFGQIALMLTTAYLIIRT